MPIVQLNQFNGGIADDIREPKTTSFSISKHFNIHNNPYTLTPYRDFVTDALPTVIPLEKFLYANDGASNKNLWALGTGTGDSKPTLYKKDPAAIITSGFSAVSGGAVSSGSISTCTNAFSEYKNYLYFWKSGTNLSRFGDISGSPTLTENYQTISFTSVAQGITHSKNDVHYLPYDNKLASIDGATFTATAFSVPTYLRIVSICEYGTYLAIGCMPTTGVGNSVVFLWDKIKASADEKYDIGSCQLRLIEEIEGALVAVVEYGGGDTYNIVPSIGVLEITSGEPKVIKTITPVGGNVAAVFNNVSTNAIAGVSYPPVESKVKKDNKLYFAAKVSNSATTTNIGIYVVGRQNSTYPISVTLDKLVNGDTEPVWINGILPIGNYWWVSCRAAGTDNYNTTKRTANTATYTTTAVYESLINPNMPVSDRHRRKSFEAIGITTKPLTTGQSVVVKYKKDNDSSWSSAIITHNTTYPTPYTDPVGREATPDINVFKEIQFRIESTGGAEVTSLYYRYDNEHYLVNNKV